AGEPRPARRRRSSTRTPGHRRAAPRRPGDAPPWFQPPTALRGASWPGSRHGMGTCRSAAPEPAGAGPPPAGCVSPCESWLPPENHRRGTLIFRREPAHLLGQVGRKIPQEQLQVLRLLRAQPFCPAGILHAPLLQLKRRDTEYVSLSLRCQGLYLLPILAVG